MGQTLNLKSGSEVLASIRIMNRRTNKALTPILHENTVRFVGSENGEIYFEVMKQTAFDLTIDILNTNKDKINKIDLLRLYEKIIIERNQELGCSIVLEEYITDKGGPLMFRDEKSRCLGEIKIRFDRVFGASISWEIYYCWAPKGIQTVVIDGGRRRTETDGCSRGRDVDIDYPSRALLKPGRALEQVKFRETSTCEKFYAYIKYVLEYLSFKKLQCCADCTFLSDVIFNGKVTIKNKPHLMAVFLNQTFFYTYPCLNFSKD